MKKDLLINKFFQFFLFIKQKFSILNGLNQRTTYISYNVSADFEIVCAVLNLSEVLCF